MNNRNLTKFIRLMVYSYFDLEEKLTIAMVSSTERAAIFKSAIPRQGHVMFEIESTKNFLKIGPENAFKKSRVIIMLCSNLIITIMLKGLSTSMLK